MTKFSKKQIAIAGMIVFILLLALLFILLGNNNNVKKITITDNIVFLGDSITESYNLNMYFPNHSVINAGVWGDRTDDAARRLKKDVLEHNPAKAFILLGVNDIGHDRTNEDITNRIKDIILKIQKECPQTKIYLLSVYPLNVSDFSSWFSPMSTDINRTVDDLNVLLYKLAKELEIPYIDVSKYLKNSNNELKKEFTEEGLHLTEAAYVKITEVLIDYMK
ncbi:MAG: hypothetical protein KAQ68_09745 [Clostridiales bacterium]|nr:hypothetical protein [Clostridiales bacterium]